MTALIRPLRIAERLKNRLFAIGATLLMAVACGGICGVWLLEQTVLPNRYGITLTIAAPRPEQLDGLTRAFGEAVEASAGSVMRRAEPTPAGVQAASSACAGPRLRLTASTWSWGSDVGAVMQRADAAAARLGAVPCNVGYTSPGFGGVNALLAFGLMLTAGLLWRLFQRNVHGWQHRGDRRGVRASAT